MQRLVFTNANGVSIDLTKEPYGITKWTGFANANLNIQSQQVPFHDGAVFLDALIGERSLSVTLAMNDGNDLEKRYELRRELISVLNPKLGEGVLVYTNDFISKQIKCVPKIPLFDTHNSNTRGTPKASLAWTACNPYWEDLEESFEILDFGQAKNIKNDGDFPCDVKIDFLSTNMLNPKIKNLTTNKIIKLNGEFENKNAFVNTEFGKKSAYSENFKFLISTTATKFKKIIYVDEIKSYLMIFYNDSNYISGLLISKDAINWSYVNIPYFDAFESIIYSKFLNLFVIVGSNEKIYTSSDLINWELKNQEEQIPFEPLYDIAYSERLNIFVAVGGRAILTSSDGGETWTRNFFSGHNYKSIIYTEELGEVAKFIAVGRGIISYSSDGINWTHNTEPIINNICFSKEKNLFVATDISSVYISGVDSYGLPASWVEREQFDTTQVNSLIYCNELGVFFAIGNGAAYSYDGVNWVEIYNDLDKEIYSAIYSKNLGKFICTGSSGTLIFGTLSEFEKIKQSKIQNTSENYLIAYSEDLNLLVLSESSYAGKILLSSDGINFKEIDFEIPYPKILVWIETLKLFIIMKNEEFFTSSDGINWNSIPSSSVTENITDLIYSEKLSLFIATSYDGNIYTSPDLVNWTVRTSGINTKLRKIIYSEKLDLFVAVGGDGNNTPYTGIIITSSNGITWQTRVNHDSGLYGICYSEKLDLFVAVGGDMSSPSPDAFISYDGKNWFRTSVRVPQAEINLILTGVVFSKRMNMFLCHCSNFGYFYASYDGLNWFKIYTNLAVQTTSVVCLDKLDEFIISCTMGTILTYKLEIFENITSKISSDSNMNFQLDVGKNELLANSDSGNLNVKLTYRQRYIGV